MRDNEYTRAVDTLKTLVGGKDKKVDESLKILEGLVERGTCAICGVFGCMNDHGYGGPGPDAY
jgi:hypothetical protein